MSSFNPERQENKIEGKIVVALERISEAFRVLLWNESKSNALSPIQVQILIFLLFHSGEKCKVSYLAAEFNMTKATISDSVKVLFLKKLIKKTGDELDTRSFTISLTAEGKKIAEQASFFTASIEKPIGRLSDEQKKAMLDGLLKLIYELNRAGVINIQRMCFTCANYQFDKGTHYCKLLQTTLAGGRLRIDCPEHEFIS
ncbi:MarR family transcriptional regulator [Terrimonas sp.]|uniref:MarR family winged helix-turn-helix transcriptional regulator n=1 Tax=Terrimonas sp. TaxID=1914338 RepID=UPI000D525417|nr:MarR family winged helix-turn-helix transcriptional regulator [Terrimonas sp.]PVD52281.1 MarR family transcriptional regulator [Terrimonas sp.]